METQDASTQSMPDMQGVENSGGGMKTVIIAIVVVILLVAVLFVWMGKSASDTSKETSMDNVSIEMMDEGDSMTEDQKQFGDITDLYIEDIKEGEGDEAAPGNDVTVHYVGTLLDGRTFDSSRDRGTPFTFALGGGQVIRGWDLGVAGMKVGGVRKLVIPASLAYGDAAIPGSIITPGSTLVFEVELISVGAAE